MIPSDKREGKIWLNNDFVDWQDAKLHVISHGLHYASLVLKEREFMMVKFFNLKNIRIDFFTQQTEWI
jgi:Branched-chain amino acid aminotransferase/4-amino-4-deoxychorismate lyase